MSKDAQIQALNRRNKKGTVSVSDATKEDYDD